MKIIGVFGDFSEMAPDMAPKSAGCIRTATNINPVSHRLDRGELAHPPYQNPAR